MRFHKFLKQHFHLLHLDGILMILRKPFSIGYLLSVQNHPKSNRMALHILVRPPHCEVLQNMDVSNIILRYIFSQG